jgi:dipeptidyl aminopeptidase/acylaminoacyl peptidase
VLTPADLRAAHTPGQVAVRGDRVVYTLRGAERTDLWEVGYASRAPRRLTESPGADTTPRLSRDGVLAFLRAGADGIAQACVLADGTVRTITSFRRGVHDFSWYPDGSAFIVVAEDDESALVVGDPAAPTAIVLRHRDWRTDGEGDRLYPRHLHRVGLDASPLVRLTEGRWSASRPRVAEDGTVHFLADPSADADLRSGQCVLRIAADGSLEPVATLGGGVQRYHLSTDGIRALGRARDSDADPPRWHDSAGRALWPGVDLWAGMLGDETDLHDWSVELDDDPALTTLSESGSTTPVFLESGEPLLDAPVVAGALAADGAHRVGVLALAGEAPDLYAFDEPVPRRLTNHADWLAGFEAPRFETMLVDGPAGAITTQLLHPSRPAAGPAATVLLVHGGPTGQWGVVPPLEALLLAGAGYLVALPNIRGSVDRGAAWVAALGGRWGDADAADCAAVCDSLVAQGLSDPVRLGVSGLSYGGFVTQWLVATTNRFAAAVSENGVSNQIAAWGSCADGPYFNTMSGLGDPLTGDGATRLWAMSPLAHVANVQTPVLMLQADDDRTCPASDNEQFFVALRTLRREVEYVRYPDESHLMQGTGRIDRRIDRHQRVIEWFERFMAP